MPIPNPATTEWVPLQGSLVSGLAYWGAYESTRTYNDGDCMIGADGVLYMCVKDGTIGVTPVKWPGAAAPQGSKGDTGPQGIQGVGVPMPVVNGQWIKGVGGAAVWQPILQSDLPTNLQAGAPLPPILDCNSITTTGWYWVDATVTNKPSTNFNGFLQTYVAGWNSAYRVQQIYDYSSIATWRRQCNAGTWSAWADISGSMVWRGPFSFSPGSIGYNSYATSLITHNYGRAPDVVQGWIEDVNYGINITWATTALGANNFTVFMQCVGNIGGGAQGTAIWHGWCGFKNP